MFRAVDPKVSFPQLEEGVLAFWQQHDVFKRSIDERPADRQFIFYEGPPTANARPGIHHVLARVFKDLIPRYKTMRGYRVPRKAGWDTHGLPVELEIEIGAAQAADRIHRQRAVLQQVRQRFPADAGPARMAGGRLDGAEHREVHHHEQQQ